MTLKFYNTLTGSIDEFVSISPNKANIYTCGPTVYYYPHIGNWAAYIYWDTLVRILKLNNYDVVRVMNITDVGHLTSDADEGDDKMQVTAKREGKNGWEIAKFYTDYFLSGLNRLNIITPNYITKATEYITQQQELIRALKNKGFTYQTSDGIYFDTSKFPEYSDFAKLNLEELKSGARVEANPEKRNPSDFALWKFSPLNEKRDMEWPTPKDLLENVNLDRMGFPGWHLECSAMAMSILGNTIDIHTGGIDAIPVHHTNEIAQSEAATGVRFCNYWLHNNFLMCNGTKISKSLGNTYVLEDLENQGFGLMDFRMLVLQGHYRNAGNFTFASLESARNRLKNWRNIAGIRHQINDNEQSNIPSLETSQLIIDAISNDLGTPEAMKIIDEAFSKISSSMLTDICRNSLIKLLETIDLAFGLDLIKSTPDISDEIKSLLLERHEARNQKDWPKSDQIRNTLLEKGYVVRDLNQESIWEYKS